MVANPPNPQKEAWYEAIATALKNDDIRPIQSGVLPHASWVTFQDETARLQAIKAILARKRSQP